LKKLGYEKHYPFPAAVHQFLSPNDNRWHGMAKAIWKARIKFFQNDVMSSLFLLSQLDIGAKYGPHWFNKNMQIDEARVSLEIVQSLIQSTAVTDNRFF